VIVLGEQPLGGILRIYFDYYGKSRTHLSLTKDPPESRAIQPPEVDPIMETAQVGGFHPRDDRRAA
jgi:hypothetical protein